MINDTYRRIQVRAQARVQNTSTSTSNANDLLPKVKDWCRTRYDRILRSFPWSELTRDYNLSITANTRDYALRYNVESIIKIFDATHGNEVKQKDIQDHIRFSAPLLEVAGNVQTGNAENYIDIGSKSISAVLSQADVVEVLSTSASDTSPVVVRLVGEVSGMLVSESITLTGVTAVDSTHTYDAGSELTVSVGTSDGTLQDAVGVITVRENATPANILCKISPEERAPLFRWIRLSPTPSNTATYQVWYKRKWKPLTNDNDVPIIPCANEIVEGIVADALAEDGQDNTAQESKFSNSVTELWYSRRPRNLIKQAVPDNEDTLDTNGRVFYV